MQLTLSRALLLFDQGRYDLAENEARRALSEQPDDGYAHALLALCLLKRKDYTQAMREATEAVRLNPTVAYSHYVAGHILLAANRHDHALKAAEAAIAFDPSAPTHYALVAQIHLDRSRWREALKAAETGLAIDPENVECNNARGMALVKLGRRAEAGASMQQTLALDPHDAFTHANQGWALLHERKPQQAMQHFREALRIDPTLDWARAGIVEALKAKNFIYRWMLAYFLFMSRLGSRAQWLIMMGGWFGAQALKQLGKNNPAIGAITTPIIVVYAIFAILTWLAYPFFNLLLRLNKFGRLALSREQIIASNCVGLTLLVCLLCIVGVITLGWSMLIDAAIMSGLLALPVAGWFGLPKGWPRYAMLAGIVTLIGIGAMHLWRMSKVGGFEPTMLKKDFESQELVSTFAVGIFITTIAGNVLAGVRIKKG
jgi:tetratricopeptide (TPR) repeat protein